jgi:hypothetical protein
MPAYRQAGMFVAYLHDTDVPGFARMMNAILNGRPFVERSPLVTPGMCARFGNNSHEQRRAKMRHRRLLADVD